MHCAILRPYLKKGCFINSIILLFSPPKLCDLADPCVLVGGDGLPSHVNHLVEEERPAATIYVLCHAEHGVKVAWPHVLAGVHPEAVHAHPHNVVEVASNLLPYILLPPVQVIEGDKVAVPDLAGVVRVVQYCLQSALTSSALP